MTLDPAIEHCQFANWYPVFKSLSTKAVVLDAPESFREYLQSDGIALHGDADEESSEWESDVPDRITEQTEQTEQTEHSEPAEKGVQPPPEFHQQIEKAIRQLNGEVVPKLNWSAPVDAKWILPSNTMRCTAANDVYMLLKSSDYINHDLQLEPPRLTLVLREWFDVHPSHEFRVFVRDGKVVGVSQRDMNFYEFLGPAEAQIQARSEEMAQRLSMQFPDPSFVFDIYVSAAFDKAWLVDINPWLPKTDSLLFSWDELPTLAGPEVRLVDREDRSRAFSSKPHSSSQVPYELVDMPQGSMQEMLEQMKEQRAREQPKNAENGAGK